MVSKTQAAAVELCRIDFIAGEASSAKTSGYLRITSLNDCVCFPYYSDDILSVAVTYYAGLCLV